MDWRKKTITVIIVAFLILSFVMAYVPLLFPAPEPDISNNDYVEEEINTGLSLLVATSTSSSTATSTQ